MSNIFDNEDIVYTLCLRTNSLTRYRSFLINELWFTTIKNIEQSLYNSYHKMNKLLDCVKNGDYFNYIRLIRGREKHRRCRYLGIINQDRSIDNETIDAFYDQLKIKGEYVDETPKHIQMLIDAYRYNNYERVLYLETKYTYTYDKDDTYKQDNILDLAFSYCDIKLIQFAIARYDMNDDDLVRRFRINNVYLNTLYYDICKQFVEIVNSRDLLLCEALYNDDVNKIKEYLEDNTERNEDLVHNLGYYGSIKLYQYCLDNFDLIDCAEEYDFVSQVLISALETRNDKLANYIFDNNDNISFNGEYGHDQYLGDIIMSTYDGKIKKLFDVDDKYVYAFASCIIDAYEQGKDDVCLLILRCFIDGGNCQIEDDVAKVLSYFLENWMLV